MLVQHLIRSIIQEEKTPDLYVPRLIRTAAGLTFVPWA